MESPLFETYSGTLCDLKSVEIDTSREIREIRMKVSKNDCIDGIKLLDKDGEYIVNELMGEERENRY